jgi:homoserine kinase type II
MEEELVRVLGHYALGGLKAARRTKHGFVNDNWIVDTERGRYFLKRRHPRLRWPDLVRVQHDLVEWLRQAGLLVPAVVPTATGETLLVRGGEFYEIHAYIEGEPYSHDRPAHLEEAALILAHYHTHVEGFAPQVLCDQGELYSPAVLSTILGHLTGAWQLDREPDLAQAARQLEAQAADLAACFAGHGALPHRVIHGDYYAGNLLFDGDRIIGIVDYDKARWQPRVVELAEALIYFASPRPGHLKHLVYPGFLNEEPFARFLQTYLQTYSQQTYSQTHSQALVCTAALDENEVRALPDYVRCIWLSVSLKRLLEKGPRPPEALEALQEVLALAGWAKAKARWMVEVARSAGANV